MNTAEKIWYTWMLVAGICCLVCWLVDEDKHPNIVNALISMMIAPVAIGVVGLLIYLIWNIWK